MRAGNPIPFLFTAWLMAKIKIRLIRSRFAIASLKKYNQRGLSVLHHPSDIILFFGRFHVLLVHLPIGMLLLLALLELFACVPRFKHANAGAGLILALAAPITVITAICGWLLSQGGGYAHDLLEWHERMGIATAVGCVLAAILFKFRQARAYRITLFLTVVCLTVARHLGGSLTHGSNYLTRYAPMAVKRLIGMDTTNFQPVAAAVQPSVTGNGNAVYTSVIAPVLRNKCAECHGPQKSKGGLRLDSYAAIQAGGDDGLILDTNHWSQSELLRRILLPLNDDDHMPPEGKTQLTQSETALLRWWVQVGAPDTNAIASLLPPKAVLDILTAHESKQ